jgi:hypothetical protein
MKYAQIKGGNKLHLVYEAGEGVDAQHLIPINCFSAPLSKSAVKPPPSGGGI